MCGQQGHLEKVLGFPGACPCSLPLPAQRYGGHPQVTGRPSRLSSTQSRPWGRRTPHSRRSHPAQSHSRYCEAVTGSGALGQGDGNVRLDNRKLNPAQQGHNLQINEDTSGAGPKQAKINMHPHTKYATSRDTCRCRGTQGHESKSGGTRTHRAVYITQTCLGWITVLCPGLLRCPHSTRGPLSCGPCNQHLPPSFPFL